MGPLSEDKVGKVQALLAYLPSDMADRLCAAAVQGDPALGQLMTLCREGADAIARRRIFQPLEPVSGDPELDRPSRAYTPVALLASIWAWLDETVDPEGVEAVRAHVSELGRPLETGELDPVRLELANKLLDAIETAEAEPKQAKKLRARLGVESLDPVRNAAVLLRSSPVVRKALDGLPAHIPELTDALSKNIRDRYEAVSGDDPDAAVWLLFLLMARMDRPWRILRVFERIARREDDLLVSQTDMAGIGDALLLDAEHELKGFARPPETDEDTQRAIKGLKSFSAITVGMTREIGIRKDGEWGKHLFDLRSKASDQMARIHDAARDAFWTATPEAGGLKRRVGAPPSPGEPGFVKAQSLGQFLIAAKDDAGRAAVGSAHNEVIAAIRGRLEAVGQEQLSALRNAGPEDAEGIQERLRDIALLMESVGENEAAVVLLRRVAAARAA
jgi:hypothetical protein